MLKIGDKITLPDHGECTVQRIYHNNYQKPNKPTVVLKPSRASFSLQRIVLPMEKIQNSAAKQICSFIVLSMMTISLLGCATSQTHIGDGYTAARQAYKRGNYETAIENYQMFLEKNPDSGISQVAMYYLAESYKNTGKDKKAAETYKTLISKYKEGMWVKWANKDLKEIGEDS